MKLLLILALIAFAFVVVVHLSQLKDRVDAIEEEMQEFISHKDVRSIVNKCLKN